MGLGASLAGAAFFLVRQDLPVSAPTCPRGLSVSVKVGAHDSGGPTGW